MKVRIKFAKLGCNKFLGHLDTMRYFQKAIRRADLPTAFSEGFSPHMILSFASPLGVGITSTGEYFDLVLKEGEGIPHLTSEEMVNRLNAQMAEGMHVYSCVQVPENKASNAMALVAAADYTLTYREGYEPAFGLADNLMKFYAQDQINILRKTKRSEKETDIRPWIYSLSVDENNAIHMQLSCGSVSNLKPDLVMEAFYQWMGMELPQFALQIHRDELYGDVSKADGERDLVPLEELGIVIS